MQPLPAAFAVDVSRARQVIVHFKSAQPISWLVASAPYTRFNTVPPCAPTCPCHMPTHLPSLPCGLIETGQDERKLPRSQRACKEMKPGLPIDTRTLGAESRRAAVAFHRGLT